MRLARCPQDIVGRIRAVSPDACTPHNGLDVAPVLRTAPPAVMVSYGSEHRMGCGTGRITPADHSGDQIVDCATEVFARSEVAYIDVRSTSNNFFSTRIPRDD